MPAKMSKDEASLSAKEKQTAKEEQSERFHYIGGIVVKLLILIGLLYMFICSLDFLSDAFRLVGGKAAGEVFRNNAILNNPIADLMIGVLATVLLQSSSTTTSIVVTMVAADIVTVRPAIFLVMGANIGTTVTNSIVSTGHVADREEFRRAFSAATIHDMFNWFSVFCLLPIEWISGAMGSWKGCGLLCQFTGFIVRGLKAKGGAEKRELLKKLTKPFTSKVIQLDKKVLNKYVTLSKEELKDYDESLVKHNCKVMDSHFPIPILDNDTNKCAIKYEEREVEETCEFLFESLARNWTDQQVGGLMLACSLLLLTLCLMLIVKLLHSLLKGKMAVWLKTFVNADFPGKYTKHLTGYLAILVGAGLTILVQSSSVFTSAMIPLAGVGVLELDRMYPLTLGANIGTTFTAILASLASDGTKLAIALQVALSHLFFNIIGILIWYPIPFMREIPLSMARKLGNITAKYRWFAFVYMILMFFLVPGLVFALSIAHKDGWVLLGLGLPMLLFLIAILVVNKLQVAHPDRLPPKLQNWDFLPIWLHSLEPYDQICIWAKDKYCGCCKKSERSTEDVMAELGIVTDSKASADSPPVGTSEGVGNPSYIQDTPT